MYASGKFKSVPEILKNEATPEQQERLAHALRNLFSAENILTIAQLIATVESNKFLLDAIGQLVTEFLMSDMGYSIA